MTRKSTPAKTPTPRRTVTPASEKAFLREVKKNMAVDSRDDLDGPRAMAKRAKRGTPSKREL
jgi:hypothetical protein